ncbi:RNA helicase [Herbaspirillum sp. RU 5E]|nr:RNA helicase [Herbaspirillum sp. RU 5E]
MGSRSDLVNSDLDVVYGEYNDFTQVREFVAGVTNAGCKGTLYIGYPVLSIDDGKIEYDALLVSPLKGIIVFDLYSVGSQTEITGGNIPEVAVNRQEQLYAALFNRLNSFKELRRGRSLVVEISTISINPVLGVLTQDETFNAAAIEHIQQFYEELPDSLLSPEQEQHLNAAIQRISNLKPQKKRDNVVRHDSYGAKIKQIEAQIANLDLWQKRGSIEYVNGPQRIRGLAGSGKTVVLALKAAYLHVKRPDWNIAITFNSRALYQQFEALLTRFVFSQINDEPDWEKLRVMHSWGDSSRPGIYSTITNEIGSTYRDFGSAARLYGYSTAFSGACEETLKHLGDRELEMFDMILVDEAQDLPSSFFKLIYKAVKDPKRIIWAYDDLQNLGDFRMPSPKELFGLDEAGAALVRLQNRNNYPQEDIVLPRCYRTPPRSLVTAHGLGFGIHHEPLVQMFPEPDIWRRLGYTVTSGELALGQNVVLARDPESVPEFFGRLLGQGDTIKFANFRTRLEQYDAVAAEIRRLIDTEELQCSDFLIVIPDTYKSKSISASMLLALQRHGLAGRIPGVNSSRDSLFAEEMIAITHIHRAKGNEAAVVFVIDADYCSDGADIKQRRNILFTAITRSRAWAYVSGVGERFSTIEDEGRKILADGFTLKFEYPTAEQIGPLSVTTEQRLPANSTDEDEQVRNMFEQLRNTPWEQLSMEFRELLKSASNGS